MAADYDADDAVEDYLAMHPEADEGEVRAELEQDIAKIGVGGSAK